MARARTRCRQLWIQAGLAQFLTLLLVQCGRVMRESGPVLVMAQAHRKCSANVFYHQYSWLVQFTGKPWQESVAVLGAWTCWEKLEGGKETHFKHRDSEV